MNDEYQTQQYWNNMKQPLNEEFKRMQRLAGIQLNEIKFKDVNKGETYIAVEDFGIFKKGDKVKVDQIKNEGQEVILFLSKSGGSFTKEKSNVIDIKGDLQDDVEVFN